MYNFLMPFFYFQGAGKGAAYFWRLRLRLRIFFGAALAPVFVKRLGLQGAKNMRFLAAPAPQP